MKNKTLRQTLAICALIALAASFSSCNRGYGCPSNFSVDKVVGKVVVEAIKSID